VTYDGEHYGVRGARIGPPPAHPVEIWLGAYKRRMLALTGAKADGWVPSMGYVDVAELPRMNATIDDAAVEAGRRPEDIRRMLNLSGDFLQDAPVERLLELTAIGERLPAARELRRRPPALRPGRRSRRPRAGRRATATADPAAARSSARWQERELIARLDRHGLH
jgi:alkanesulfonate monooxygenase SsuD/methylene tetrahydromethanopterin reductase-like flavin-dependent oxidoreductase (luciferase family)